MIDWYNSLSVLGRVYFYIASIFSVFLIIQLVLMLFSFAGGDADVNGDGIPDDAGLDSGVTLFTVKSLTAFFTIGGWVGLAIESTTSNLEWLAILLSVVSGLLALFFVAFSMKWMLKLQASGNIDKNKLVGKEATVYVSIMPSRTGRGKITLTAQGQYREIDAVTDDKEKIMTDELVVIQEYKDDFAVVSRKKKEN